MLAQLHQCSLFGPIIVSLIWSCDYNSFVIILYKHIRAVVLFYSWYVAGCQTSKSHGAGKKVICSNRTTIFFDAFCVFPCLFFSLFFRLLYKFYSAIRPHSQNITCTRVPKKLLLYPMEKQICLLHIQRKLTNLQAI